MELSNSYQVMALVTNFPNIVYAILFLCIKRRLSDYILHWGDNAELHLSRVLENSDGWKIPLPFCVSGES